MANITGTAGNNTLTDTSGDDTINALAGNDIITVTSGRDTVDGGTGTDVLVVAYGALTAGISNNGESQFNEASGLGATSVTFSNIERFNVTTGSGDDTIRTFVRNSFSDSIVTSGADVVSSGAGNDRVAGGGGNDFLRGGAGDDVIDGDGSLTGVFDGSVQTFVFTGNDRLLGDAGNDTLYGGAGDDTLEGGADNDYLDGDAYAFTVRDGSLFGSGVTITPTNVDAATGTHDDNLLGGAGTDTLVVRYGRDTVDGGAGLDTLVVDYSAATFGVINNGEFQFNSATGLSATSVQFDNVERFDITTGASDDNVRTFVRDSFDNAAIVSGDDIIRTGGGNDRAGGGDGADVIYGGDGNDSLDGDGALIGKVGGFGGSRMTWVFSGDDMVFGEGGDDTLFGGLGSNTLDGGIGNDILYGDAYGYTATDGSVLGGPSSTIFATDVDPSVGTNVDTLIGGDGDDVIYTRFGADIIRGGSGTDTLVYDRSGTTTGMTVDITSPAGTTGDGVTFTSIEQLQAIGGSGDDTFTGGAGNDSFRGGAGSDVINGGGGDDTATTNLQNEAGADTINLGEGNDTVNVSGVAARQIRVTFTSSEVGNGNANDSNTMQGQDGGLAVRLQAEDADGNLTGLITRTDDEGITFIDPSFGATFDVRDLVSGAARGDQFRAVILGTSAGDVINANATPDYING
ncbi:MAG: calcium-binding protein, partial [Caulobacteraceae bacterium]